MTITLTYFGGRGKAEHIRLILNFLQIEFKDERISSISDELRSKLAFGQVPLYEDGEVSLVQSAAIARYIANKYNFAGANAAEKAQADAIVDSLPDVITPYRLATDDAAKLKFRDETLPKFLKAWDNILAKNGGNHFVGAGYTWADIAIYYGLWLLENNGFKEVVTQFPKLATFLTTFEAIPHIATYLKNRPDTKF
ncbi:putative glutathione S-transferase [Heterostelium album PN500]|uniref:Putative glutathione S-transferase n=1 Tax=Heterostelium pallidum (strain ATCC 26659 / Pp 5 / PN500) TaxID=670386 RepID=D3AYV2_HETP5|nr:putative glutathione S-transferase [Heterostelium album PN500]EFA85642.1 putative glutathione S-transferase [Heterostelium album PN500]|eukprot:XP_020437749.1 putative glutathione S-transferase [Heterostelium album PN500]